jgi:excinuclease UvrABC ATPase subunit
MERIEVIGARQHNLKGVSVSIPKRQMTVFTGVSGSGKSSLVFDTVCTEAQRQLIETFSAFARKRLPKLSRPEVDEIRNLSPVIIIDQKRMGTTLASTVGTATEVYTYLRLLFSRCGEPIIGTSDLFSFNAPQGACPKCEGLGMVTEVDESGILDESRSVEEGGVIHPSYRVGTYFWKLMMNCGLFDPRKKIADFTPEERFNLLYSPPVYFHNFHHGVEYQAKFEGVITSLRRRYGDRQVDEERQCLSYHPCKECGGSRLNERARPVAVNGKTIPQLVKMEMPDLLDWIRGLDSPLAKPLARRMEEIVSSLIDIGAGYLSLDRPVATLSGGESQRVKMARQLDCALTDLVYVLDEPSIGMHPRDIGHLLKVMDSLKAKGNTLLVVEHDPQVIMQADNIVDLGPGAGVNGGELVFAGSPQMLLSSDTLTGRCLREGRAGTRKRRLWNEAFRIEHACENNLKDLTIDVPKGVLVCVTGVAGSGKSSLISDVFVSEHPEAVVVDQSPIGRTSRSNPVSYIGAFELIRKEFAKATGAPPGMFTFNSEGGCPRCTGAGVLSIEMSFLDDIVVTCEECGGKRYRPEALVLKHKGKDIAEVLQMTAPEAIAFFGPGPISRKLQVLDRVGLGYLELGQSLSTLSGGEAQRLKLASELGKKGNIYVMDEPTTGLHRADIDKLMTIIDELVDAGNSVIVIEHNLDVIAAADWVIDLGPEGGRDGGFIVAQGTPEDVAKADASFTGRYLRGLV